MGGLRRYITKGSIIRTLRQILLDDEIKDEIGEVCSALEEMRNAYRHLVGKREGKESLGRRVIRK